MVDTASDAADSNNQSHFSEIYFDNEDDFQDSGIDDEHECTATDFTMLDYQQDGDDPTRAQRDGRSDLEEVDQSGGRHAQSLQRLNRTSVPVIGMAFLLKSFYAPLLPPQELVDLLDELLMKSLAKLV
jgi:hypothetical protein